jgi:hypothetical protein
LVTGEDIGKNPVSEILGEWRETGFLRRYSMRGEDIGKNPVSEIVGGGEKPGFYEDIQCEMKISEKTRFLRFLKQPHFRY